MLSPAVIPDLLEVSAERYPERVAVENPAVGRITYRELDELSARLCDQLCLLGVTPGDRVGICLTKSIDAVASIFGVLRAGAAYVPLDPNAPASRNGYILHDCRGKVAIVEDQFADSLRDEMGKLGSNPQTFVVHGAGNGQPLREALGGEEQDPRLTDGGSRRCQPDDLAYILYTSGSTGPPKGVMLSHRNAISYVDWCSEIFQPTEEDRFSSHAPFHFDLSILDIYVPIKHGTTIVLIGHHVGREPGRLAPLIAEQRITVWYSTPSILNLLLQYGKLDQHDYSSLRFVLFAGEVFPVKQLRAVKQLIPHPRYFNLYGPTETNVCTFHEIPRAIPGDCTEPYPIGKTCSHLRSRVVGDDGHAVDDGEEGELCIRGPAVTDGYWNLSRQTAEAFIEDADGKRWYRTGDIVCEDENGDYVFRGRRDRMIKKRGYRVELGEIEACLHAHPMIREAAVIAQSTDEGLTVKAFVSPSEGERMSTIALKQYCMQCLPAYMVPDSFSFHPTLPMTSTDKVDYQALLGIV